MNNEKKITCPTCSKPDTWHPTNKFRPFCSDRCKLIDLGEWARETRKIPSDSVHFERSPDEKNESYDPNDYFF